MLRMSEAFHHPGSPKEPSSACVAPSLTHPLSVETVNACITVSLHIQVRLIKFSISNCLLFMAVSSPEQ